VIFRRTPLADVVVVDLERKQDDRGFFARTFCREEFAAEGLEPVVEQCSISFNHRAGTLRGMHYQVAPATEAKLVRVTSGAVLDQVVDVRPGSPTYLASFAIELTAANRTALYVPPMCAHGFQTLEDGTELSYSISSAHTPGTERGLRHDDPALALRWPLPVSVISDRDRGWPLVRASAGDAPTAR
jgi:dTDP-4-dehydrorhamnose 3,5-epimerase